MRKLKDRQKRRQKRLEARQNRIKDAKGRAKEGIHTDSDTGFERICGLINRFTHHLENGHV